MAGRKSKKALVAKYEWTKDWILHNPEEWIILVVALLGFADLVPTIDLGHQFRYTWPIIITAIFLYKLGCRKHQN
jgi:hypothetical protein